MKFLNLFLSIALFLVFQNSTAFAFPEAPFNALETEVIAPLSAADFDFNGIVSLSNCSASLVRFSGQPMTSKAYVLTNGHCLSEWGQMLEPGEVRWNESKRRSAKVFVNLNKSVSVSTELLAYATMTDTDSALYRLNETYASLSAKGAEAFELSSQRPGLADNINVVSGYWKKGFSCNIEAFVYELLEGGWTFKDSIRYSNSGCEVYGGTSGSPIIADGQRLVVGVNNTGNESGGMCGVNNPCEVDKDGNKSVIRSRGYGQQTYKFYTCLSLDFNIDLNLSGCELPKPN